MYVTVLPPLSPEDLIGRKTNAIEEFSRRGRISLYRYGRDALYAGLEALRLSKGDVVALPATICDVVLLAFVKKGIEISFYDLDANLNPSMDDIERGICARTRAVYVNHQFGLPTDFTRLKGLCQRRGLYLIEDCAHTLPVEGSPIGSFGDIAYFSLRKLLSMPDGGLLCCSKSVCPPAELPPEFSSYAIASAIKQVANYFALHGLLPVAEFKKRRHAMDRYLRGLPLLDASGWRPPRPISSTAAAIFAHCDLTWIKQRRQENYAYLTDWVSSHGGHRMRAFRATIPPYAVPFSCPVIISEGRDLFLRRAADQGIYLEPTLIPPYRTVPGLLNPDQDFPFVQRYSQTLVSLPVHQGLGVREIKQVTDRLQRALNTLRCRP